MHRQLPQQLITQSKLLMSTRLLEIQNEILRRFQNCRNREFVKRMFYRQMENLASLQQKISYLMIMLEEIDSDRLDSYLYSSLLNDPYYYDRNKEIQTDTSMQHDVMNMNKATMMMMNNRISPKKQYNTTSPKYHGNTAVMKSYTPSKSKDNLLTHTTGKRISNNYYSQLPLDNTETDQAIISSLQNSSNSHLYKDLINMHRSKKSQALLASADSMIHNQNILHQLKKLQMEKKLLKYQARRTPSYTQSPIQCLQTKINQCHQDRTGYLSDYQQQTDADVESSMDKDITLKKLQKNYRTTTPKHSLSDIKQNRNHLKNSNTLNDLFSFRPNDNIKKQFKDNNRSKVQFGKNNKKKVQFPSKFLEQEQDESQQLERNFRKQRQQHLMKKWEPYREQGGLMSEEDAWLIDRLNRKIRQQDSLNSMMNYRKPFRVNSEKTLSQYESKLQRLQQQRFASEKQAQHRSNQFGGQLSDVQLKQRLKQFKSWLNNQPPSNQNNYHQQSHHNKSQPQFRLDDLNYFEEDVIKNKRQHMNNFIDKDYICYSQSERRKYNNNNNVMYEYDDGDRVVRQSQGGEMFKKKPQLIATQTNKNRGRNGGRNGKSKTKTKSKSKQLIKASQQSRSRSKGSPFNRLLTHSTKKPTNNYLPKTTNKKSRSKQQQKHHESQSRKEDKEQIEKRATNRLLNRVRSSGCMIGEIPFSREKEDHRQLMNRYLVDGKRQQQVKQKIVTTNAKLESC